MEAITKSEDSPGIVNKVRECTSIYLLLECYMSLDPRTLDQYLGDSDVLI